MAGTTPKPSDDGPPSSRDGAGNRRRWFGWLSRADAGRPEAPSDRGARADAALTPVAFQVQDAGPQNPPLPVLDAESAPLVVDPSQLVPPNGNPDPGPMSGDVAPSRVVSPTGNPGYPEVPIIGDPEEERKSFSKRLADAYFGKKQVEQEEQAPEEGILSRRQNLPAPFAPSPPFPFAEHMGPNIGVNDTSVSPLMEAIYNGPNGDAWKKSRFKIYGWVDPSYNASTSKFSNVPLSYDIVPNAIELSQAILIFERTIDTVQQEDFQIGGKFTNLYGIDYRYTTAKGYFSDQLLKHNNLYGYDPLQMYLDLYFPKVAQGMVIRMGRYISPIDIEAQLSPENYLYTHSLMYTYDPYTFTGIQFITLLKQGLTLTIGAHAGNDMAPWTTSSQANGEILLKYVPENGKDCFYGGLDSIGHGYYQNGHDDLQVLAGTWTHKFTDKFHTLTEAYFIWERDALVGGSITGGPPQSYFEETGPGAKLPGLSYSIGAVNYTAYALSKKSYVVWRNDVLDDPRGYRTGFPGAFFETTLGWAYHITPWALTRPEIRFDWTSGQKAYDNGTKREQFTFSWDIIIRF
jgi:Putative beta-barrel porin-2, OmpL-like. bbp2